MTLKGIYYGNTIYDFDENNTYIEEGHLKDDKLDGTFGRRIYIKGTTQLGWFLDINGSKLHGYGMDFHQK